MFCSVRRRVLPFFFFSNKIYAGLYIDGCTQEQYAESVGYTPEYIQSLNTKPVKYFQSAMKV